MKLTKVIFLIFPQNKHQVESIKDLQSPISTGKKQEMIHQNNLNDLAIDFQHTWARKMNKASLCVLDESSHQKMLTQIAKSTKAAIHLHGKLQVLFINDIYFK